MENVKNEDGTRVKDDFDEIIDVVISTVDDFQWVLVGYVPEQLKELAEKNKIQFFPMQPIIAYPSMIEHL
jgi:hypothetical protein